jgi:hypothetical protein
VVYVASIIYVLLYWFAICASIFLYLHKNSFWIVSGSSCSLYAINSWSGSSRLVYFLCSRDYEDHGPEVERGRCQRHHGLEVEGWPKTPMRGGSRAVSVPGARWQLPLGARSIGGGAHRICSPAWHGCANASGNYRARLHEGRCMLVHVWAATRRLCAWENAKPEAALCGGNLRWMLTRARLGWSRMQRMHSEARGSMQRICFQNNS